MGNILPDLEVISKGLCFPLYWYEPATDRIISLHQEEKEDEGEKE